MFHMAAGDMVEVDDLASIERYLGTRLYWDVTNVVQVDLLEVNGYGNTSMGMRASNNVCGQAYVGILQHGYNTPGGELMYNLSVCMIEVDCSGASQACFLSYDDCLQMIMHLPR
ncbi:hypothetical protein AXG93_4905s1200 [Marchantia polymorpha subsp. ruderalis]|uniref:Uncharacterized protein n=1 Tax=Marchantia polymorpha subsp. ruderalis TaxID=1480154 RepID=A0A176VHS2_MARPO|nr:hypothetical protein AXG93_4905s1200 [Marchantia polymorpha subsp. ruderalis]